MAHWHATSTLVGLPGMPAKSARSITLHGSGRGWISRTRGRALQWLESSLPKPTQEALQKARDVRAGSANGLPDERYAATADARLDILDALDRWLDTAPRGRMDDALVTFAGLYTAGEIDVDPETRERVPDVSRRRLYDWRRLRRGGGGSGLMPRYDACGPKTPRIDADPEMAGRLEAYILQFHPRDTAPMARRWLIAHCGAERVPSLRAVQRWMARWRRANARLLSAATDPDGHRSRYMPAFGAADTDIEHINQRWELDSTPADVLCTDGRHTLVGAIDVCSRRVKVHVARTSRATAIAAVLRCAILDWGVPETVATDEGKDYVSKHVRRVLADLDIEHDILPPYSPEKKPFIERFFGTLTRALLAYLPGYAGANVAERQRLRARRSFAARRGEDEAETFAVALTAAELQDYIDRWIAAVYEHKPHSGLDGRSPLEAAAGQPARRIANERALDLLLAPPPKGGKYRTVSKDGLRVGGGTYWAAELGTWIGCGVEIRLDPIDFGVVYAFAGDVVPAHISDVQPGQYIATAEDARRLGTDRAEVAARAKAHAQAADRAGRAFARQRKREFDPDIAPADVLRHEAERTGQVLLFPGGGPEHDTPALDEAASARQSDTHQADDDQSWLAEVARLYEPQFRKKGA